MWHIYDAVHLKLECNILCPRKIDLWVLLTQCKMSISRMFQAGQLLGASYPVQNEHLSNVPGRSTSGCFLHSAKWASLECSRQVNFWVLLTQCKMSISRMFQAGQLLGASYPVQNEHLSNVPGRSTSGCFLPSAKWASLECSRQVNFWVLLTQCKMSISRMFQAGQLLGASYPVQNEHLSNVPGRSTSGCFLPSAKWASLECSRQVNFWVLLTQCKMSISRMFQAGQLLGASYPVQNEHLSNVPGRSTSGCFLPSAKWASLECSRQVNFWVLLTQCKMSISRMFQAGQLLGASYPVQNEHLSNVPGRSTSGCFLPSAKWASLECSRQVNFWVLLTQCKMSISQTVSVQHRQGMKHSIMIKLRSWLWWSCFHINFTNC